MNIKKMMMQEMVRQRKMYKVKKEQNSYRELLGKEAYKGTEVLFNQNTLGWLIVIVTVFLQLISLATTYEGSKMYFGGIYLPLGLSAPVLFAIAIQVIVFAMSHIVRRQYKIWLLVILVAATLCSTYFSYIGIYNHINPPIDYLEERYEQIYDKLNNQQQLAKDEGIQNMKAYVFDLIGDLNLSYLQIKKQVEENQLLEEMISNIEVENEGILPQINSVIRPNRGDYGENIEAYYADMLQYNEVVAQIISETTTQDMQLEQEIHKSTVEAYLGGRTEEAFIKEAIELESAKEQIEKAVYSMMILIQQEVGEEETLDTQLTTIQMYCLNFITSGEGDKDIFTTILTQFLTVGEGYIDAQRFVNLRSDLGHFILLQEENHMLLQSLDDVKKDVYEQAYGVIEKGEITLSQEQAMLLHTKMQAELKQAAYELNQLEVMKEEINLTHEDYTLYNLYILPLKNLIMDSDVKEMAWFCLAFAILIDGLTLMFAVAQGKEKNLLFVTNNKQITKRAQEGMEELLITTIMDHYTKDEEEGVIGSVRNHLREFLKPFKLLPEGVQDGYSMFCSVERLEAYNIFIAVLCQFNLAVMFNSEELWWLDQGEHVGKKRYILLKTKFVIWAKQKIADLAFKEEYIDAVRTVDVQYVEERESVELGGGQA